MKAVIRRAYGPPNIVKMGEMPTPIPKDNEVLIRVHATTVNRTDCAVVTGQPFIMRFFTGLLKPNRPVPGTDFAGEIEAIGKNVTSFKIGDKVWGFNDEGYSTQAEYTAFPEKGAITLMPENTSFEQAAASIEAAHYARNFLNKVELKAGQKILINGATGAIGSALLQFIKAHDIFVTAVCNTPNIGLIKALGADKIYDYLQEDFTQDDEQYHYIFDAVGKSTFGKCKHLLLPGGVYISSELGPNAQNPFLALITPLIGDKKVVFPLPTNIKDSLEYSKNLIQQGKFKAVIDRTYQMDQIAEAYEYVNSGQKTGNVILDISNS
ncbi:UNVERIFIED_CONTAM: hypothetical protein GTU68_061510 [Idotea baltica]|nr:hypothetical protein [Idotea baltica]